METFRLVIWFGSGLRAEIYGTEEVLKEAMRSWRAWVVSGKIMSNRMLAVHGFTDTCDKASLAFEIDLEEVIMMSLVKMYTSITNT